jgi:four helix bundle protein
VTESRIDSYKEFISKMRSGQQELDETAFWLEFLERSEILSAASLSGVRQEVIELIRIFSSSIKTAKANSDSR